MIQSLHVTFSMAKCSCSSSNEVDAARAKTTQNESKWNFNQFIDTMSIWKAFPKPTLPQQKPRLSHIESPSGGSVKRLASQTLAKTHGIMNPKVINQAVLVSVSQNLSVWVWTSTAYNSLHLLTAFDVFTDFLNQWICTSSGRHSSKDTSTKWH